MQKVPSLTWNSFKGAHNFLLCPASAVNEVKRAEMGVQFFIYLCNSNHSNYLRNVLQHLKHGPMLYNSCVLEKEIWNDGSHLYMVVPKTPNIMATVYARAPGPLFKRIFEPGISS